jgi:hypothetical protein
MPNGLTGGEGSERATGTPNTIYDLSSVLFHALEGGASYDTYIEDAEREGDQELADFFIRVRDEDSMRADEAQRLLAERTPTAARTERAVGGAPLGTEDTLGAAEGRPDMDAAPTGPGIGAERGERDISPRTADPAGAPPGREPDRDEDKGLLDRAKEALTGEDQPRREEREPRRDDPLSGRP